MSEQLNNLVDNKYLKVREKAHNLENEIEDGEKQYKEHVMQIILKIQSEYYKKHGSKIEELQDLMDAIEQYQNKGYRQLKKQLQRLYLEDMTGGGGSYEDKKKFMKDMENFDKKKKIK